MSARVILTGKGRALLVERGKLSVEDLSVVAGLLVYYGLARTVIFYPDFVVPAAVGLYVGILPLGWRTKIVGGLTVGIAALFIFGVPIFSEYRELLSPVARAGICAVLTSVGVLSSSVVTVLGRRTLLIVVLLVLLIANFVAVAFTLNSSVFFGKAPLNAMVSLEPPAEQYSFDGFYYLKMFYLMEQGYGFYDAQATAYDQDARKVGVPPEGAMGWRLPTVFLLWKLLLKPEARGIIQLFVLGATLALVSAFLFAGRFLDPALALLSSILLAPYFLYGAVTMWFPFPEYWGSFFGIYAVALFVNRDAFLWYPEKLLGISVSTLAFLAASIREHMLYIVLAGLLACGFAKRVRSLWIWIPPIVGFAVLYIGHYLEAGRYYDAGALVGFSPWWLHGGIRWIREVTSFGLAFYPRRSFYPFAILVFAAIGAQLVSDRQIRLFLTLILAIPLVTFAFFGRQWSEYWGAVFMPLAFMSAPLIFLLFPGLRRKSLTKT